jgi:hypothetical protein
MRAVVPLVSCVGSAAVVASFVCASFACASALPLVGCDRGRSTPEPTPPSLAASSPSFDVRLVLDPESPRVGSLFAVVATVHDRERNVPVVGAEVSVDATMPEHGHGMMTSPRSSELGGGRYRAEGMKFHMHGRWVFRARVRWDGRDEHVDVPFEQLPHANVSGAAAASRR